MKIFSKLSKREKILSIVLIFLIIEFVIYTLIFSNQIKAIQDLNYKTEELKIENETNKIIGINQESELNNDSKEIKSDDAGFLNEFKDTKMMMSSNYKILELMITDINSINSFSKYYTYNKGSIIQNETGYNVKLEVENNGSVLPTILPSNENIKDKYISASKLRRDNILEKNNESDNKKKHIEDTKKVEELLKNENVIENTLESKNSNQQNTIVIEETPIIKNESNKFPMDFNNTKLETNNDVEGFLLPIENGFTLYVKSITTSQLEIINNTNTKFNNIKLTLFSPEETSALLKIDEEYYDVNKGENLIELKDTDLNVISIIISHAEENLFSFTFEEIHEK